MSNLSRYDPTEDRQKAGMMIVSSHPTAIFLGVCAPCVRPVRVTDEQARGKSTNFTCPECGRRGVAERLYAVTNAAEPCDGRCMGATGPSCSCQCGGKNHGGAYSLRPTTETEVTAGALAGYRQRVATREAQARRRADATRTAAASAFDQWADEHRDIVDFLAGADIGYTDVFLDDMACLIRLNRPLTDNQAAAVRRVIAARQRFAEQKAAEQAAAQPVPTGDAVTITGEVVHTRRESNPYGPGSRCSMLVKGDGWRVWSSVPGSLASNLYKLSDLKGQHVRFVAAVTASADDASFGYAKRPRKAEMIEPAK